jgi:hypothetical protein
MRFAFNSCFFTLECFKILAMSLAQILENCKKGNAIAKSHMKDLIEMALVDGKFAPSEQALLESIAKRNGVTAKRLNDIKNGKTDVKFELPSDPAKKFNELYNLVQMMRADDVVH